MKNKQKWMIGLAFSLFVACASACGTNTVAENSLSQEAASEGAKEVSFVENEISLNYILLTEQQKESLQPIIMEMADAVVGAVHDSKETVDLSDLTDNKQAMEIAIAIACYADPLTEIAGITEDSSQPGLYHIEYGCTAYEHKEFVESFEKRVESIKSECEDRAGEQESEEAFDLAYAKAVFEYLSDFCSYDYGTYESALEKGITIQERQKRYQTMSTVNVIMNGGGVCRQFSFAYSYLLKREGVESIELAGMSNVPFKSNNVIYNGKTEGDLFFISHMWNGICIDSKWYAVDITYAVNAVENGYPAMANRYFGMGEYSNDSHFSADMTIASPGYENMELTLEMENLEPSNGPINEYADIGVLFDDNYQVQKDEVSGSWTKEAAERQLGSILFEKSENRYPITVIYPEGYVNNGNSQVCYVLEESEKLFDTQEIVAERIASANTVYVCIDTSYVDIFTNPAVFLNELTYGLIPDIEDKIGINTSDRILAGAQNMGSVVLFTMLQSDGVVNSVFTEYIAMDPNLINSVGNASIGTYERFYFDRCNELEATVSIIVSEDADDSAKARIRLLADYIKKREYKKIEFHFVE